MRWMDLPPVRTSPTDSLRIDDRQRRIAKSMARQSKLGLVWGFLRTRKKWWLTPIVVTMMLLGVLILLSESSAVAPFIYALF